MFRCLKWQWTLLFANPSIDRSKNELEEIGKSHTYKRAEIS